MQEAQENFYFDLKSFKEGRGVSDIKNYVDVPSSWHVVLVDVRGSTKAIQSGRYKEVNMVGASAIAAVCNVWDRRYLPYVFGGDGATFLVPQTQLEKIMNVLASVAQMAKEEFALELRVGSLPIADILKEGGDLRIAKQALSPKIDQAIFSGGGLTLAEDLIKARPVMPTPAPQDSANYEGLECRWQPIESRDGEILSVLIRSQSVDVQESFRVYQEIIDEIDLITGGAQSANPARKNNLKVTSNPSKLMAEMKVRESGAGAWKRVKYMFSVVIATLFGKVALAFRLTMLGVNWGRYKEEVIENSDFWKFDDMLRFVLDVSPVQKRALISCLENRFAKNDIFYGMHSSSSALMTCLVFDREGEHIHFMDGDDGGYALAAVGLKGQISHAASLKV